MCAPRGVRLPPPTFARDDRGPEGVLGAPVGGVERRIEEEVKTAANSMVRCGEAPRVGEAAGRRGASGRGD